MRQSIQFLLGQELRELAGVNPNLTVLEYLRRTEGRCGTKEGCAEGDCGACTVVLAEPDGQGGVGYQAVNSCIQLLSTLNGKQLLTVEDLKQGDGSLHPVQKAMCDNHASQCGFCTPGFVMSLFANWQNGKKEDRSALKDTLAGNLCRCTGYGPILDAGEEVTQDTPEKANSPSEQTTIDLLNSIRKDESVLLEADGKRCFIPGSADELAVFYESNTEAQIIAGLTDVGLWITKQHHELPLLIQIGDIPDLKAIEKSKNGIRFGAAVTLSEAHPVLAEHFPAMNELMRRFAARQIRNAGTLCGNIANGSPIGDSPPALIALNARLHMRRGDQRREIALENYFIEYGKQDRQPGEFIEAVTVPYLGEEDHFACYKLSKRIDQDISAVMAAFRISIKDGTVTEARICYGGMAGIPARATGAEIALVGQQWSEEAIRAAMDAMASDFTPLTDMRASANYRMKTAQNLLLRVYLESADDQQPSNIQEALHG